ncbi:MAG: hypothetical protein JSS66_00430 [Armatimonadetes bacterium]|nr:hypothetical protein [Armatimonadota bacterium]
MGCLRWAGLALLVSSVTAQAQDPYSYKVFRVTGPPGSSQVVGYGLTPNGNVVGWASSPSGYQAFYGKPTPGYQWLATAPGYSAFYAAAGNATGLIVGLAVANQGQNLPVYWGTSNDVNFLTLPQGREGYAASVNIHGDMVMDTNFSTEQSMLPFVWINGVYSARNPLPGMVFAQPSAILDDRTVIGNSGKRNSSNDVESHATYWNVAGDAIALQSLGGYRDSSAFSARSSAAIVGNAHLQNSGVSKPVIWENFQIRALPDLGTGGDATGINANGDVVGTLNSKAIVWRHAQTAVVLNTLADPSTPGWNVKYGNQIADTGEILAMGSYNGQNDEFVILVPVFSTTVSVEAATVNLGWLQQGDVFSLNMADGDTFRVCKFVVPNQLTPPVMVTVAGHTPFSSLSSLRFVVLCKAVSAGSYQHKLELFNFPNNAFDLVDVRTDTLSTDWSQLALQATGNVSRYRRADGLIRGRYSVRSLGPGVLANWCVDHDLAEFQVAP